MSASVEIERVKERSCTVGELILEEALMSCPMEMRDRVEEAGAVERIAL